MQRRGFLTLLLSSLVTVLLPWKFEEEPIRRLKMHGIPMDQGFIYAPYRVRHVSPKAFRNFDSSLMRKKINQRYWTKIVVK